MSNLHFNQKCFMKQTIKSVCLKVYFIEYFTATKNATNRRHCPYTGEYVPVKTGILAYLVAEVSEIVRIQSECGKIRTRKNHVFGNFSRSGSIRKNDNNEAYLSSNYISMFKWCLLIKRQYLLKPSLDN